MLLHRLCYFLILGVNVLSAIMRAHAFQVAYNERGIRYFIDKSGQSNFIFAASILYMENGEEKLPLILRKQAKSNPYLPFIIIGAVLWNAGISLTRLLREQSLLALITIRWRKSSLYRCEVC